MLITHAHDDHFAGVTTLRDHQRVACFPNARHLIAQGDGMEAGAIERGTHVRDWDNRATRAPEVIHDEREVVPGVTMIPAPVRLRAIRSFGFALRARVLLSGRPLPLCL